MHLVHVPPQTVTAPEHLATYIAGVGGFTVDDHMPLEGALALESFEAVYAAHGVLVDAVEMDAELVLGIVELVAM